MSDHAPPEPRISSEQQEAFEIAKALIPLIQAQLKAAPGGERFEFWLSPAPLPTLLAAADVLRTSFAVQLQTHAQASSSAPKA